MEKKRLTGKDILRMDGLLPPTRRLPVCDAVSTSSEKKKDKKWSIDGLLKRFSLIKDYESSSNEEEMVYCKREPKRPVDPSKKTSCVVLKPVRNSIHRQRDQNNHVEENNIGQSAESLNVNRDSIHSRSSDGSLDGLSRRVRRSKVKARVEAKRDRLCVDSSSDEDSRKSSNSLTKTQNDDSSQNSQKSNSGHKKTRAARTERYIKRLSRDEGNGSADIIIHDTNNRKIMDQESYNHVVHPDPNGQYRPPLHPRRLVAQSNDYNMSIQRSVECVRDPDLGIPDPNSLNNYARNSLCQYVTDFNQNNAYKKNYTDTNEGHYGRVRQINRAVSPNHIYVNYPAFHEPTTNLPRNSPDNSSIPPSGNAIHRSIGYESNSYPFNPKNHQVRKQQDYARPQIIDAKGNYRNLRPYSSNNEITNCGIVQEPRRPMSLNSGLTQLCDCSQEYLDNKYSSLPRNKIDSNVGVRRFHDNLEATEATRCQRRNSRNEQLNSSDSLRGAVRNKLTTDSNETPCVTSQRLDSSSEQYARFTPERSSTRQFPIKSEEVYDKNEKMLEKEEIEIENKSKINLEDEEEAAAAERKRNSKNLEEALSELEAIYNSLRLGDEDLLDRAERRSMEEFSQKRSKRESEWVSTNDQDSPDRTKDDMAYRRMHPKERPASLSEIMEQSSLSNISYLIASPILSRKNTYGEYACIPCRSSRRDEPDVTRDDVVFRSINRANNTLKVLDPQPPFGIPIGPVTAATESDYLHTTPRKSEQPRSSYIPQVEPDVVTDDLAFRALRKDTSSIKKPDESNVEATRPNETQGPKKKRAVRSLSANLYGLINHDSIQLHKQSSFKKLNGESNYSQIEVDSSDRSNYFRRVVSDGELSDRDSHRHIGKTKADIDINGNHSCQKKLRVYVSPVTTMRKLEIDTKKDVGRTSSSPKSSDALLNANSKERSDSRSDYDDTTNNKNIFSRNFTEYSRLCQNLVDSIETPDEKESIKEIESDLGKFTEASALNESNNVNETNVDEESDRAVVRISSLGRLYAPSNDAAAQNKTISSESDDLEDVLNFNLDSVTDGEEDKLDYYLRLADENVKLIAEAFSSVADHIQDSEVGNKKTPTTSLLSDVDEDTTASEEKIDEEEKEEGKDQDRINQEKINLEPSVKEISKSNSEDKETTFKGGQSIENYFKDDLELSKAVHDLEIAAASLRESVKQTEEELETRFAKSSVKEATNKETTNKEATNEENKENFDESDAKGHEEKPDGSTLQSITSLEAYEEGENTECEFDGKIYDLDLARSSGLRTPYVTNIIAITITTYSMVLLACLLALLLAIVAAS